MTTMMNPEVMTRKADKKMEAMGLKGYNDLFESSLQEVRAEVRSGLKANESVDTTASLEF